jgi:predicted aspartyl protease
MGSFEAQVRFSNLEKPEHFAELSLVVDTGATLSWIPRRILENLQIVPLSRLPFTLAGGRVLERDIGGLLLTIDGRRGPVPVAFAESGEHAILGATALETLGLVVDPVGEKLIQRNLLALVAPEWPRPSQRGPRKPIPGPRI